MFPYGRSASRIKLATRYLFRRRTPRGVRHLVSTDGHAPHGHGADRSPPRPLVQLLWLGLPPLVVGLASLGFLAYAHVAPTSLAIAIKFQLFACATIVFAVRALTARRAPRWVRWTAFAATLPFPVGVILLASGVWS